MSTKLQRRQSIYGWPNPIAGLQQEPIIMQRDPTTSDAAEIGTIFVNTTSDSFWILTSSVQGVNTWTSMTGGAELLTALTVTPGDIEITNGNLFVDAGNISAPFGLGTFDTLDVTSDATIGGTLAVTGDLTADADLTVDGTLTINGPVDLNTTGTIHLTSTDNVAAAIRLETNGGTSETLVLEAAQGTGSGSITLDSVSGGILVEAGLASASAIVLNSTNAAGGVTIDTGTAGFTVAATNGAILLESGTAAINIGTDAVAHTITLGNVTGATTVDINAGTAAGGAVNIATGAHDTPITLGNSTGATAITLNNGTGALNLGTNAIAHAVNIGNATGASTVAIQAGTGASGSIGIGATAHDVPITIGNSTGATVVDIYNGTGALNLGTNAVAHAVNVGNNTGATVVSINGGTGAAGAINIGTTANAVPITIGNVTGATGVTINTGTNGFAANTTGVGTIALTSANDVTIAATVASDFIVTGATQDLTLSSVGGSVNVVATEAVADAIVLNASDAAGGVEILGGTNGLAVTMTNGPVIIASGTGVIDISNDATATEVSIATGAGAKDLTLGSATASSTTTIQAGTGGVVTVVNPLALGASSGPQILAGSGTPNGSVTAPIGSIYCNTTAATAITRLYVNTDSGTTWVNVTCAG